jgi:hypothetical protein
VKSQLLKQLADTAGGASYFGFIPDGSMNATVFNCALANLHVTCAADVSLTLRLPGGGDSAAAPADAAAPQQLLQLVGGYGAARVEAPDGGVTVTAAPGALRYDAPRSFLIEGLPGRGWERLQVEVSWRAPGASPRAPRLVAALGAGAGAAAPADARAVAAARHRLAGADAIRRAARVARMDGEAARAIIREAAAPMLAEPEATQPPVLGDMLGEVSGALASPEAYNRWGEHFLRFCPHASLQQARLNFKDPGGLAFGGAPFAAQLATLDAAFTRAGVPTPSLLPPALGTPAPGGGGARGGAPGAAAGIPVFTATVFADTFNNQRGGCFALSCAAALPGGATAPVGSLRAGDLVLTGATEPGAPASARIRCVVDYAAPVRVVTLPGGGPTLTPWHPVLLPGAAAWQFPARVVEGTAAPVATAPRVRTFVLEPGAGSMLIDGVRACTLGHGLASDDVIAHPFYGTQRVVDDLSAFPGWERGHVTMGPADEVYDEATGVPPRCVAFRPAAAAPPAAQPQAALVCAAGA